MKCSSCNGLKVFCGNDIAKCDYQTWIEGDCFCDNNNECPGDSKCICDCCSSTENQTQLNLYQAEHGGSGDVLSI